MRIRITVLIVLIAMVFVPVALGDLIGHWDLEEGSGPNTSAAVGSPPSAKLVGWTWETSDLAPVVGGTTAAIRINGAGNGIILSAIQGPAGDTPRTICAWLKADAEQSTNAMIVSWGHNANEQRYSFRINTNPGNGTVGALRLEVQGGYVTATTPVNDGTWHHVAVVRDTGVNCHDVTLYVDGVAETATTGKSGNNLPINTGTTFNVSIGNSAHSWSAYGLDGSVDDVRVYDRVLSAEEIVAVMTGGGATDPSPSYGAEDVAIDAILSWTPPEDPNFPGVVLGNIISHDIYIGTSEADVIAADIATEGIYRATNPVEDTTYQPGVDDATALVSGTTYYWRIDEVMPGDSNTIKGETWKFTTVVDETVLSIIEHPQSIGVIEGEDIVLEVLAANATGYQWFFNDGELAGKNESTLTVPAAQLVNEGDYKCRVSKDAESIDSDVATVFIKRLMGHWKLDDTLVTELGDGFDGYLIGVGQDPNYVDGINGKALELYGEGRVVEIEDSAEAFNFYTKAITASAWIKTTQAGYGAYISKQDRVVPWKGLILSHNSNSAIFNIRQMLPGAISGAGNVADGQWHMVTGTSDLDSGIARLYVDGELLGEYIGVSSGEGNELPLVFGRETIQDETAIFQGQLDDVHIWNYSLDAMEVALKYNEFVEANVCIEIPELDFNGDCIVNLADFAEIAAEWMECNNVPVTECN